MEAWAREMTPGTCGRCGGGGAAGAAGLCRACVDGDTDPDGAGEVREGRPGGEWHGPTYNTAPGHVLAFGYGTECDCLTAEEHLTRCVR
jgi:hypothetical protein